MSIAKHHAEWLSLIEVSGPFLSLPVLVQRFPQGMDAHDPEHAKALRPGYEEWGQAQNGDRPDPAMRRQWIGWVLGNTLDLGNVLVEGQKIQGHRIKIANRRSPGGLASEQGRHHEAPLPNSQGRRHAQRWTRHV